MRCRDHVRAPVTRVRSKRLAMDRTRVLDGFTAFACWVLLLRPSPCEISTCGIFLELHR